MVDRSLRIKLLADISSYRSEMERASRLGNDYYKSAQSSSLRLTRYLNQNTTAFAGLNKNIQTATNTLKTFAGAFIGGFAVSGIVNVADNYGQMAQRIRNSLQAVEGDISSYETVQSRLLETSIRNAKDLADSQELYIRSAESMKTLGYNTTQTVDFVESLSSAFTSNAASSDKVKSSIDALNKSLVSGKVSTDQWTTLSSTMPNLAGQIARALGKERDEIMKLGNTGKLSIKDLTNGVIKSRDAFNNLADSMDNTVKDGFVQLSNAFQSWIGEANQTHKVTSTLVSGMTYLAKNFDIVVNSGAALVALSLARYFGNLSNSLYSNISATIANTQAQVANAKAELELAQVKRVSTVLTLKDAEAKYAAALGTNQYRTASQALAKAKIQEAASLNAVTAAQQRLNAVSSTAKNAIKGLANGALGLIGGPMGAAMLAGGALLYFAQQSKEARDRALDLNGELNKLTSGFENLTDAQLELRRLNLLDEQNNINDQIQFQQILVDKLTKEYENLVSRSNSWYSSWSVSENAINEKRKEQLEQTENLNKLLDNQRKLQESILDIEAKRNFVGPLLPEGKNNPTNKEDEPNDTSTFDIQKKRLEDLIQNTKLLTEYDKIHYEVTSGSLKNLNPLQQKTLENLAKEIDLTKKRDDLKKSLESLGTPIEKQEALYKANNKIINDSLKAGIIDKEKANKKLEELEQNHQLAIAKIKAESVISDVDKAVAQVDPVQALKNEHDQKLALIQQFQEKGNLIESQALALREAAQRQYEENRIAAQWEIWSKQSEANEFLAASLEGLASSATSTISGLLSGTMSATEAMQNFANIILNQAIGSLVQMGLQQVQNAIVGQTVAQATTALQIAEAASLTAAYTPAAIQASIATQGAAATTGQAAYTAAVASMSAIGLAGMAHDGIDNVPKEGTWLLDRGERVVDARTNADLKSFLRSGNGNGSNITVNVPVSVGDSSVSESDSKQLGQMIKQSTMSIIQEQMRPGGLLNKR